MKKFFTLVLTFVLCFSLVACGQSTPSANQDSNTASQNTPADTAAPTVSNIQLPTADAASVIRLLSTVTEQLDAAKIHFETTIGASARGFLLERAMEYYVATPNGFEVHGLLMQVKGDIGCNDALYDYFQIGIDLTTNEILLSYTDEFNEWFNSQYTGEITCGRDALMLCTAALPVYKDGTQFYFPNEQTFHFSQDILDEINAGLGWSYTPYPQDVPTEDITTTAEERITLVTDAVNAFLSQRGDELMKQYATLTGTPNDTFTVSHAMEYRLGSMDGYPVHALLIHIRGNFAETHSSNDQIHVFFDLQTGEVFDSFMINDEFFEGFEGFCRSEADVPLFLLNLYYNVTSDNAPYVVREGEKSASLTEDELATVNSAFAN